MVKALYGDLRPGFYHYVFMTPRKHSLCCLFLVQEEKQQVESKLSDAQRQIAEQNVTIEKLSLSGDRTKEDYAR